VAALTPGPPLGARLAAAAEALEAALDAAAADPAPPATLSGAEAASWPAPGRILRPFGEGERPQGVVLAAPADALARAPQLASLRWTGALAGLGAAAVLELGEGLLVLVAGLGSSAAEAGAVLDRGAPLETAPLESAGAERTLYIEVRRDGQPIDPAAFFASTGERTTN
jgi:septal ring factor EnvC (AmiA/AmiB activator)